MTRTREIGFLQDPLIGDFASFVHDNSTKKQDYLAEAACATFGMRVRQFTRGSPIVSQPRRARYYKHPELLRIAKSTFSLPPDPMDAKYLVRVVVRFIGQDYHLLLRKSFLQRVDETYTSSTHDDPVWLCRLFTVLALGELYSKRAPDRYSGSKVPGTAYFCQAVSLFQDLYEEADVDYIETLLLMVPLLHFRTSSMLY